MYSFSMILFIYPAFTDTGIYNATRKHPNSIAVWQMQRNFPNQAGGHIGELAFGMI